ncbi:hypoxanthine phosphoribosyltransferase [candidate division GN15 bacterium]|nr:hypoxanthine phosphoribosyltransferase [candidate division GN15 bacterium]
MRSSGINAEPRLKFERLLDAEKIERRVTELGLQIARDYKGKAPLLLGVLKGCIVFMADLMRHIDLPLEVEFISAESYRHGSKQDAEITVNRNSQLSLKGRDVLIVEGIVDSGRTASAILENVRAEEPASVEVVTLIDKPASRRMEVRPRYIGFKIGNDFVIGYGLDNTQKFRNLPYIGRIADQ